MDRLGKRMAASAPDHPSSRRDGPEVARRLRGLGAASILALVIAGVVPALAGAVTVSPLPGTPDASPSTQISVLGTAASNISSVSVTGSSSGMHTGHLVPYSASPGASFLLDAPLSEGEQVNVVVSLKEGAPVLDSFSVAHLSEPSPQLLAPGEKPEEQEHFLSAPELHPPKVKVNTADPSLEGDIFLDPLPAPIIHVGKKLLEFEPVGPNGLMILNPEGKLIWWDQMPKGSVATNLELTNYEGKTDLAWWQGTVSEAAFGRGEGVIANSSYEPIARIKAGNGYEADIHELNITPTGTAYIDVYSSICLPTCDETHPPVLDSVVQQIDIRTGLVMWEWHAMTQIPITDTEVTPANGVFDPYHLNSVQPLPEHRVLVSLRDTSAIYEIDQNNGSVLWTLGGTKSSFTLGKGAPFYFQHDARLEGPHEGMLTLFDNEAGPPLHGVSRGLTLRLNYTLKRASVLREYLRPEITVAGAEGGAQQLPGGHVMVGYGATQFFSEFNRIGTGRKGALLFDAELPKGDGTYRVLRFPWHATPKTLPAVVAKRQSLTELAVYASWNGATDVASWEVLAGESPTTLSPVASAPWSGFETAISVPSTASVVEVTARNAEGKALASSEPVSVE